MSKYLNILFVGGSIFEHPVLHAYLEREIANLGLHRGEEFYCRNLESELTPVLHRVLESTAEKTLIVTDTESFAHIGRILGTLTDDNLHQRAVNLPSEAAAVEQESYLYEIDHRQINVIRIAPGARLPKILLEPVERRVYHFFPEEESIPEALRTLLRKEHEALEVLPLLPGWYQLTLYGEENLSRLHKALDPWRKRMIPGGSLVEALIRYLATRKKKITFAESCTGGLLAATFTSQSGASDILEGSYVTYANRIKYGWLGVEEETLKNFGAVSRECVLEMAEGAQRNLGADIAIAVSGIAGPTGAVPGKPVGTVYLCLRNGTLSRAERLQLEGDRNAIQQQTVLHALKWLVESEENIFDFFSKNP